MVRGHIYVVGLDPYVVGPPASPAGEIVQAIGRLRDACLWLAGEIPYREFPAEWVVNSLREAQFDIVAAERFAIRYKPHWIDSQLDMALQRLPRLSDADLAGALERRIEALGERALALCVAEDGLGHGYDYVVAARP